MRGGSKPVPVDLWAVSEWEESRARRPRRIAARGRWKRYREFLKRRMIRRGIVSLRRFETDPHSQAFARSMWRERGAIKAYVAVAGTRAATNVLRNLRHSLRPVGGWGNMHSGPPALQGELGLEIPA